MAVSAISEVRKPVPVATVITVVRKRRRIVEPRDNLFCPLKVRQLLAKIATSMAFFESGGKMLLPVSLLAFVFLSSASSSPSQLRLSHSGYEIISLDSQQGEEIGTGRAVKPPGRNSSGSNELSQASLEKLADTLEEKDEIALEPAARDSRSHYDYQKSNSGLKSASEWRQQNAIEVSSKVSSGSRASSGVYLTLGIPRRLVNPKNPRKETSNPIADDSESRFRPKKNPDDADWRDDREDPRKMIGAAIGRGSREKKVKTSDLRSKSHLRIDSSEDESVKNRQTDREPVINPDRIGALVVDAHRGLDLLIGKTGSNELDNIAELPSIQIREPTNYWLPSGIRSPIYSMGFDVLADDHRDKPMMAVNLEDLKEPAVTSRVAIGSKIGVGQFALEPVLAEGQVGSGRETTGSGERSGFPRSWSVEATGNHKVLAGSMAKDPSNRHYHRRHRQHRRPDVKIDRSASSNLDENEDKGSDEIFSAYRSRNFNATGNRCKQMKNVQAVPAFYRFMANFSTNVLDNVLRYETRAFDNEEGARKNQS